MPENARQRDAFDRYFRLGPDRSLRRLHEVLAERGEAPTLRTLEQWSTRYHWQHRIADYERRAGEADDETRREALRAMQRRHAQEALLLQQQGSQWLTELATEDVSADAAIRAVVEGAKLERLALGEATERTEVQNTSDPRLEGLSDEELERRARLLEYLDVGWDGGPLPESLLGGAEPPES